MKNSLPLAIIALAILISLNKAFAVESTNSTKIAYDETLRVDVWTSYAPIEAINDFKKIILKKYNKNINIEARVVLTPDEFFDRVRSGQTDIFSPSHNFLKDERTEFIKHNLVLPISIEEVPNLALVESRYITNSFVTENKKLYGIPAAAGGYSLLYNKDFIKTAPTSWNVLWDPKYKNKYALSKGFYEANIYITALALGFKPEDISNLNKIDTPQFKSKLKALLTNARFWDGAPKMKDLEGVVFTTAWGITGSVKDDVDNKWIFSFPQEGVTFWTDYLSVTTAVNRSPFARKLAFEWLDMVLSKSYQTKYITEKSKYLSPTPGAISHKVFAGKISNEEALKYLNTKSVYWPIISTRTRNGLKYIYDKVLKEAMSD
jgi:spermidine/putrescine transport system substrate-binding protein